VAIATTPSLAITELAEVQWQRISQTVYCSSAKPAGHAIHRIIFIAIRKQAEGEKSVCQKRLFFSHTI
jgi:hypothetical protein